MDLIAYIIRYINYPLWVYKNKSLRLKFLKKSENNQYLSLQELKELQWGRLKAIVEYAYQNCVFYKKRFDALNMTPDDINSYIDFNKIPLLSKSDIQENLGEIMSKGFSEKYLLRDMTGGSTGMPLIFYYTKERRDSREAATIRHNRWASWEIGDKVASLWGAVRDLDNTKNIKTRMREFFLGRTLLLDASSMSEKKMFDFAFKLKKFKPKIILSYANTLYLFAKFLKENNISGINPKAIVSSAEVLLPENRKFIESVFNCAVFNRYGCREFSVIASECEQHNGMHINADSLFVEFVKNGRNATNGEMGEIVITDILNYGMPLIRYKIGDLGKPLDVACECGRSLPLMDMVQGRDTDFIRTPDNKIISGVALATYVITNIQGVGQVQLVQEKIDFLRVIIVKNKFYNQNSESELLNRLAKFIGNKVFFKIEYAENISNENSGKYRFCISNTSKDF